MIGLGTGKGALPQGQNELVPPQAMAAAMAGMMGGSGTASPRVDPGALVPGSTGWLPGTGAPTLESVNPAQRETFLAQAAYANAGRAPAGPSQAEKDAQATAQAQSAKEAADRAAAQKAAAAQQQAPQWKQSGNSGDNYGGFDNGGGWGSEYGGGFDTHGGLY